MNGLIHIGMNHYAGGRTKNSRAVAEKRLEQGNAEFVVEEMSLVRMETDDGPEEAIAALHAAAGEFVERTTAAKAELEAQVIEEDKEGRARTPRDDEADEDMIKDEPVGGA